MVSVSRALGDATRAVVLAFDESLGALLIEAIEPGTPLGETDVYPPSARIAELIAALHRDAQPDPSYEAVSQRIAYLFDAGRANYARRPDLAHETITARAERLAPAISATAERLLAWYSAFAAMAALEIAEASAVPDARIEPLLALAAPSRT